MFLTIVRFTGSEKKVIDKLKVLSYVQKPFEKKDLMIEIKKII